MRKNDGVFISLWNSIIHYGTLNNRRRMQTELYLVLDNILYYCKLGLLSEDKARYLVAHISNFYVINHIISSSESGAYGFKESKRYRSMISKWYEEE